MPLLSIFTPPGLLEFSSAPSEGEKIYRSLTSSYRDPATGKQTLDLSVGTHQEAKIYGWAMAIADASMATRQAGRELVPETSYYELAAQEAKYQIVPGPNDSTASRRAMLALRRRLARGPRYEAMVDGLSTLLGSNFLGYRPIQIAEAVAYPADPSTGPGVFARPELAAKTVRFLTATARSGTLAEVVYENWNPKHTDAVLIPGDVLAVDPGVWGLAEKVIVVSASIDADGTKRFSAFFASPHSAKTFATTGTTPLWANTKRHVMIIVKSTIAANPTIRAQVNDLLRRVMRGPTTWDIVQPVSDDTPSVMGPFQLGVSPLGAVPVELMTTLIPGVSPRIDSVLNSYGHAVGNSGGQTAIILGAGFGPATHVYFGGVDTPFTIISDARIEATASGADLALVDVRVVTPYAGKTKTAAWTFSDLPSIVSVTPNHGSQTGTTAVTIVGSHFVAARALGVRVAGSDGTLPIVTNVSSLVVVDDTHITGVIPAMVDSMAPNVIITSEVGTSYAPDGVFAYDALSPAGLSAINTDIVDTDGGDVITVLGSSLLGAVIQTSPDNATWTNCTATSSTSTTATGTTVGPLASGNLYVRAVVSGLPSSNQILIEAWNPTLDADVTLLFDGKSNPYNATTGVWAPRYAPVFSTTFTNRAATKHPSDGAGGVSFDGDAANEGGLGLATNPALTNYIAAQVGTSQMGSFLAVHSSQTTYAISGASFGGTPYVQGTLLGAANTGPNRTGAVVIDGVHSAVGEVYDGSAYYNAQVPMSTVGFHTQIMRWNGQGKKMELSVDGALKGTGFASTATLNVDGFTNGGYTGNGVIVGTYYDDTTPAYQIYKGSVRCLGIMKAPASNLFVTKWRRWAIARHGAAGAPTLGAPLMSATYNAAGTVQNDIFDPAGGDVVLVKGIRLQSLTSVMLDGVALTITPISANQFSFVMPAKTIGNYELVATNATGTGLSLWIEVWDPSAILSATTYLDSRRGVSVTGANINSVTDQSVAAAGAWAPYAGATPANGGPPQLVANTFGNKPGMLFAPPGADNVPSIAQALVSPGATGIRVAANSMFAAVKWTSTDVTSDSYTGNAPLTLFGDITGSVNHEFGASAGVIRRTVFSGGWNNIDRGSGLNDGQSRMVGCTYEPATGTSILYLGAVAQGAPFTLTGSAGSGVSAIGGGYAGSVTYAYDGWRGSVGWALTLSGVISSGDLVKLNKWSKQTWGTV